MFTRPNEFVQPERPQTPLESVIEDAMSVANSVFNSIENLERQLSPVLQPDHSAQQKPNGTVAAAPPQSSVVTMLRGVVAQLREANTRISSISMRLDC